MSFLRNVWSLIRELLGKLWCTYYSNYCSSSHDGIQKLGRTVAFELFGTKAEAK